MLAGEDRTAGSSATVGACARGIDHVGVTVPCIEAATTFFVQAFAASVLYDALRREDGPVCGRQTERRLGVPAGTQEIAIRMLRLADGPGIELFEFRGPRQRDPANPADFGWQHVAIYVDDLQLAVERVVAAGARILAPPRPLPPLEAGARNRFVYCATPWGSTLELISYPDPQPYETMTALRRWRPAPGGS
ncbi:MAG TPA: VOC family protein [Capillimicrobium sp.]|nr:VOC family protein [Capillimicrobium sp.]